MKSIINSDKVKELVAKAVEAALEECAFQHQANNDIPDFDCGYLKEQPIQLRLLLDFYWEDKTEEGKPGRMVCNPFIDLSEAK